MAASWEASFCDKNKQVQLLDSLWQQYHGKLFCDVVIKLGSKEYAAHANVLAAASPYFGTFLLQDMPRSFCQKTPQIIEILLEPESQTQETFFQDALERIVRFLYTGVLDVSNTIISQIHDLAKNMKLDSVETFCTHFMQGRVQGGMIYNSANVMKARQASVNTDISAVRSILGLSDLNMQEKQVGIINTRFKGNKMVSVGSQTVSSSKPDNEASMELSKCLVSTGTSTEMQFLIEIRKKPPRNSSLSRPELPNELKLFDDDRKETALKQQCTRSGRQIKIKSFDFPSGLTALETSHKQPIQINLSTSHEKENQANLQVNTGDVYEKSEFESNNEITEQNLLEACKMEEQELVYIVQETEPDDSMEVFDADAKMKELLPVIHNIKDIVTSPKRKRGAPKKSSYTKNQTNIEYVRKPSKQYACGECAYVTTKVREMTAHTLSHKYDQLICFYCDKQFSSMEELDGHMYTHQPPAPFLCTKCGTSYKTRTLLNLHIPKHLDDKPYVCEICCQCFKWKHALKNHSAIHEAKTRHLCDVCGYSTAHKSQMKAHKLIHSGDTFKCKWPGCTFETTKQQNLKNHRVTHTKERPHVCELCGQAFSLQKNMRRHMALHVGKKLVKCGNCEFATTRQDKLKEHLLKQHGVGTPPERRPMAVALNEATTIQPSGKYKPASNMEMLYDGVQLVVIQPGDNQTLTLAPDITQMNQNTDETSLAKGTLSQNASADFVSSLNPDHTTSKTDGLRDAGHEAFTNVVVVQEEGSQETDVLQQETVGEQLSQEDSANGLQLHSTTTAQLLPDWAHGLQQLCELPQGTQVSQADDMTQHVMLMQESGDGDSMFTSTVIVIDPSQYNQQQQQQQLPGQIQAIQMGYDQSHVTISQDQGVEAEDSSSYIIQNNCIPYHTSS